MFDLFAAYLRQCQPAQHRGQGLVEYALIIVLIAIAVIVLLGLLGTQLNTVYSQITASLQQ